MRYALAVVTAVAALGSFGAAIWTSGDIVHRLVITGAVLAFVSFVTFMSELAS